MTFECSQEMPVKIWCQIINLPKIFFTKSSINIFSTSLLFWGRELIGSGLMICHQNITSLHCITALWSFWLSDTLIHLKESGRAFPWARLAHDLYWLLHIAFNLSKWGPSYFWPDFGDLVLFDVIFSLIQTLWRRSKKVILIKVKRDAGCFQEDSLSNVIQQVLGPPSMTIYNLTLMPFCVLKWLMTKWMFSFLVMKLP